MSDYSVYAESYYDFSFYPPTSIDASEGSQIRITYSSVIDMP